MTIEPKKRAANASRSPLPEAELELLSSLYDAGAAEVSELRRRLRKIRPLSHASVVTLLLRLQKRGLVDRRKADVGKAYVYFPTRAAASTFKTLMGRLLERVFHGDAVSMVSSLFGAKPPTRQQLVELKALIEDTDPAQPKKARSIGGRK